LPGTNTSPLVPLKAKTGFPWKQSEYHPVSGITNKSPDPAVPAAVFTKNAAFLLLGCRVQKSLHNAQKGKYGGKMICEPFTKKNFFNFENMIIKYSPIRQHKGHNFAYLQEGIFFVSLFFAHNFMHIGQKFVQWH